VPQRSPALRPQRRALPDWKTVASHQGWSIRYPAYWLIRSCTQCTDPADADLVAFQNPHAQYVVLVERLADKPEGGTIEQWLTGLKGAIAGPVVNEKWISLGAERALRVTYRSSDSTTEDGIYVAHGVKTLSFLATRESPSYAVYLQMLKTFRFTRQ